MGRNPRLVPDHTVADGIQAARLTIPYAYFDATRCGRGLECLRSYCAEWDENLRTFKRTPKHDWASHGADAFRYLAMSWQEPDVAPEPGGNACGGSRTRRQFHLPQRVKKDGAQSSVTTVQRYFSRSSSNNQFSRKKGMSPVILTIDRTAAYSDRQPRSCSMTSPHIATEPKAKGHP
jgi:hypothetical protein